MLLSSFQAKNCIDIVESHRIIATCIGYDLPNKQSGQLKGYKLQADKISFWPYNFFIIRKSIFFVTNMIFVKRCKIKLGGWREGGFESIGECEYFALLHHHTIHI